MPGKWDLPGGEVNEGEDAKNAAMREAGEEIGCIVFEAELLTTIQVEKEDVHFFVATGSVRFHALEKDGETRLVPGHEHDDYKWVPLKEAIRMDVVPGIRRALTIFDGKEV